MKKLTTISLYLFTIIVIAILVAGLVFYQNKKDNQVSSAGVLAQKTIDQLTYNNQSLVLNMTEITKHNKQTDCWMLINGKVYNITSYFGSHPGGNGTMAATCGKDATSAYMTKDPYASSSGSRSAHSSNARGLLTDYYLGDFNQSIGIQNKNNQTVNSINNQVSNTNNQNIKSPVTPVVAPVVTPTGNVILSLAEIVKHNKTSDCWMLINGKVYNITSYFGSHPGGNGTMAATCGKDATSAYMTKDPYASSSGSRSAHSSGAQSLLTNYFIGNLNQTVGDQIVAQTNTAVPPIMTGDDEWEDD